MQTALAPRLLAHRPTTASLHWSTQTCARRSRGVNLQNVDLTGAVLTHAILQEAMMQGTDLTAVDFTEADLSRACLQGSIWKAATVLAYREPFGAPSAVTWTSPLAAAHCRTGVVYRRPEL
jgi:hypothetical protein